MRRSEFRHTAPGVACSLAVVFVSSSAFGQVQRLQTDAKPLPYLSEPRPLGSGLDGTTPTLHESAKLTASDAGAGSSFGFSVSVSGDTAVVGALGDNCAVGINCGAAYIFRFDGTDWVEEQKLTASDAAASDSFGASVSASGDTVVVGAHSDDCAVGVDCGSVYVYRFNETGWIEEQKLAASDAARIDKFGVSVSVSGDVAVVGAVGDRCRGGVRGDKCGLAYVFRLNGTSWVEEQKLTASDAAPYDRFGRSVAVSGSTAVIGAFGDDCAAGLGCGSAYVFRHDGTSWVEEQKLTAGEPRHNDWFGSSIALSGDTAVVGEFLHNCAAGLSCGSAYVYRFNGSSWVEEQELAAGEPGHLDWFGFSVSVSGDTAVVGAFLRDCAAGYECGAAYVFRFNGTRWVEEQKLTASDAAEGDHFGSSVSVSGDMALAGASSDDCAAGERCGAAYVFNLNELQVAIDIKPGSDTNPVNLSARGVLPVAVLTTSVADGDLADFDAASVDPSSLTLAGAAPQTKGRRRRTGTLEDVDGDGDLDLVVHFPIPELDLTERDTEAVLRGQTLDGTRIRGSDTIRAFRIHRFRVNGFRDGK